MLVSLIYAACNQGDWVRRTLPLAIESLGEIPHEIIIVDDQSIDGCCHNLGKGCLVVRTEQRVGVSAARRIGATKAAGDVLIFSDPHAEYPGGALARLAQLAAINQAIVQPPTKSRPQSSRVAYGGRLEDSDRGIVVHSSRDKAQQWPALINTIYSLPRIVYDLMGGWPELPGCWGYSEQAMTLLAWSCRIPIIVADTQFCIHYAYQIDRRLPYFTSTRERGTNAHYVHAAFFPRRYAQHWKQLLTERFQADPETAVRESGFRRLQQQLREHSVIRDEEELLLHIDGLYPPPATGPVDKDLLEQQRHRSLEMGSSEARPRLQRSFDWLKQSIPGCLKGRAVLDVGTHDGLGTKYLQQLGVRRVEGIELVPELVDTARRLGRPVHQGDLRRLPDDPRWDVVTCIHALEHTPDPAVAVASMARAIRPGGWLFLVVPREQKPSQEYAHNCAFPDSLALKQLVKAEPSLNPLSIRSKIVKYARDQMEIRLVVRKKHQGG